MPRAECIIFWLTIIITSTIQRINGASLKETLGSTAKSGVQTAVLTTSARYKPKIENKIFLKLSTVMIEQRSSVYILHGAIYIPLDKRYSVGS